MPAARSAYAKNLDPTLIAAVIYAESRFRDDQTSPPGAEGPIQVTPATARMIARKSGGTAFVVEDLGTPQVNIAYGAWYLRYLLARYGGNEVFALAAYGGEGPHRPLDRGRARAPRGADHRCDPGPTSTGCSRRAPGTGAPWRRARRLSDTGPARACTVWTNPHMAAGQQLADRHPLNVLCTNVSQHSL